MNSNYISTFYSDVNYPTGLIKYKDFGQGTQEIFICADGVSMITQRILITRKVIGSGTLNNIIYQESNTDDIRCLDLTIANLN